MRLGRIFAVLGGIRLGFQTHQDYRGSLQGSQACLPVGYRHYDYRGGNGLQGLAHSDGAPWWCDRHDRRSDGISGVPGRQALAESVAGDQPVRQPGREALHRGFGALQI